MYVSAYVLRSVSVKVLRPATDEFLNTRNHGGDCHLQSDEGKFRVHMCVEKLRMVKEFYKPLKMLESSINPQSLEKIMEICFTSTSLKEYL